MPMIYPNLMSLGQSLYGQGSNALDSALARSGQDALNWRDYYNRLTQQATQQRFQEAQLDEQRKQAAQQRRDANMRFGIGLGSSVAGGAILGGMAAGQGAGGVVPAGQLPAPNVSPDSSIAGLTNVADSAKSAIPDATSVNGLNPSVFNPDMTPASSQYVPPQGPVNISPQMQGALNRQPLDGYAGNPAPAPAAPQINQLSAQIPAYQPFAGGNRALGALAGGALGGLGALSGQDYLGSALAMPGADYNRALQATKFGLDAAKTGSEIGLQTAETSLARAREKDVSDPSRQALRQAQADAATARAMMQSDPSRAEMWAARVREADARVAYLLGPQSRRADAQAGLAEAKSAQVGQPRPMNELDVARKNKLEAETQNVGKGGGAFKRGSPLDQGTIDQGFSTLLETQKSDPARLQAEVDRQYEIFGQASPRDRAAFQEFLRQRRMPQPSKGTLDRLMSKGG